MDYPLSKAVPLRLVAGKFADRAGAVPGSVIPAEDWANDITDEIIAAQAAAGIAAVENQNDQLAEAIRVLARGGALGFLVKPQVGPTLSVDIEAGAFFSRSTGLLVSVAATAAGPIVAPAGNPRNDIVYIDQETGIPGIQTGVEDVAPVDPALPKNKLPLGRIKATVGMTEIDVIDIEEHRYLNDMGAPVSNGLGDLLATVTGAGVSSLDIDTAIDATYDEYLIVVDLTASVNDSEIWLRVRDATLALWQSDAADYNYSAVNNGSPDVVVGTPQIKLMGTPGLNLAVGNAAGKWFQSDIRLSKPTAVDRPSLLSWAAKWSIALSAAYHYADGVGAYVGTNNAIDGIRILPESGLITGTAYLYGVKKS